METMDRKWEELLSDPLPSGDGLINSGGLPTFHPNELELETELWQHDAVL
jgi:hypothetical protein